MKKLNLLMALLLAALIITACSDDKCNPTKDYSDPRTVLDDKYDTEATCEAAKKGICTKQRPEIAGVIQDRTQKCKNYCNTPKKGKKICPSKLIEKDYGEPKCEPEPPENPEYWYIACEDISLDCDCIKK